jgi:CDP-2,3-bis-(O-geranylgeranyl)-sn-glycerol synthase
VPNSTVVTTHPNRRCPVTGQTRSSHGDRIRRVIPHPVEPRDMDVYAVVVTALWVMLPAYIPNNAAVLAGGGRPIDGGRTLGGRRLLGDGKTWRGLLGGWAAGVAVALVLTAAAPDGSELLGVDLPGFPLAVALLFPLGAMLGDIAASFLKRRTGRERGAPFPVVDQLDFVVVSLLLGSLAAPSWFLDTFTAGVLVVVLVITPVLHVLTNALAYTLGLKDEPY